MINNTLSELLRPLGLHDAPTNTRPRCLCHNRYVDQCPRLSGKPQKKKGTKVKPPPAHALSCRKHGHATKAAAEAHIRQLLKSRDRKPDRKEHRPLVPYHCHWNSCSENPWHVGHAKGKR